MEAEMAAARPKPDPDKLAGETPAAVEHGQEAPPTEATPERSPYTAHAAAWALDLARLVDDIADRLGSAHVAHVALGGHGTDRTDGPVVYGVQRVRGVLDDLDRAQSRARAVIADLTAAVG